MEIFTEVLKICLTSVVSIALLFVFCKLGGQRQISQMSLFDYINSITIGSIAAELATDLERWWQPLTATIVYGIICAAINILCCKSIALRQFVTGRPLILYQNGKIFKKNLLRARLTLNEFLSQCRLAGCFDLRQLESAVLETSGSISFLLRSECRPAEPKDLGLSPAVEGLCTNLILDGKLLANNLHSCGRHEIWLENELHRRHIRSYREVLLAYCDRDGQLCVYKNHSDPERPVL